MLKKSPPRKTFEEVPLEKLRHILPPEEIQALAGPTTEAIRDEKREPYSINVQRAAKANKSGSQGGLSRRSDAQKLYVSEGLDMAKRSQSSKKESEANLSSDLWISPRLNLRGRDGDRAWDRSGNLPPGAGARFLELADIALGIKKPAGRKKRAASAAGTYTHKEPNAR